MTRRSASWLCLAALLACSDKSDADGEGSVDARRAGSYALCDGSDATRLGLSSGGGQVDTTYAFTNPYGHSFLFIDGHCRYYASESWLKGVVTGELSAARATEIAKSLALGRVNTLLYEDVESCPDAGLVWLRTVDGHVDCTCGCDAKAPKGVEDSINAAGMLKDELVASGGPLDGPVVLVAISADELTKPSADALAWPLIWPLSDIATTAEAYSRGAGVTRRTLTAGDAAMIRSLRASVLARDPYAGALRVSDLGKQYNLYLRDELPAGVKAGVDSFVPR